MSNTPWLGDACSLVDAFRRGELSPVEAVDASLDAIERSSLNAFSFVDADAARKAAAGADVSLPLGGVPVGVKEIDGAVAGWPDTEASLVFKDRVAKRDSTQVARLKAAGAVLVGLTNASEFGVVAYTSTPLNGTTRNPWHPERTPGGSSGGAAAAVAGGLVPLSTGGDGGGSIRIPAGFTGLVGLKTTFGRIPRGPGCIEPLTVTIGCLARSVRDWARWLDVCSGYDGHDPFSLPRVDGWEAGLGTRDLRGLRVAVDPTLGGTVVHPEVTACVLDAAEALVAAAGLQRVDVDIALPPPGVAWGLAGLPYLAKELHREWPACADRLTPEVQFAMHAAEMYGIQHAGMVDAFRVSVTDAMAELFDQVDLVLCATNPYEAYAAEGPTPTQIGDVMVDPFTAGYLTMPGNMTGCPAITIPAATSAAGLPIGLQAYTRRHDEALLLDLALVAEREQPWPLVAPGAPA